MNLQNVSRLPHRYPGRVLLVHVSSEYHQHSIYVGL